MTKLIFFQTNALSNKPIAHKEVKLWQLTGKTIDSLSNDQGFMSRAWALYYKTFLIFVV